MKLSGASNPPGSLDQARSFKGLGGNRYVEMLMVQVLIGEPWNLAICGPEMSTLDLPGQGPLASERVLCSSSWDALVLRFVAGEGNETGSGASTA